MSGNKWHVDTFDKHYEQDDIETSKGYYTHKHPDLVPFYIDYNYKDEYWVRYSDMSFEFSTFRDALTFIYGVKHIIRKEGDS